MEDFKYLVWHQSNNAISEDILLCVGKNGSSITLDEEERADLFSFMSISTFRYKNRRHVWKLKKEIDSEESGKIRVYIDNFGYILIDSHFSDVDDGGRKVVFLFCTKIVDGPKLAELLLEMSVAVGKKIPDNDMAILRSISFSNLSLFSIPSLIVIIAIILWILISRM